MTRQHEPLCGTRHALCSYVYLLSILGLHKHLLIIRRTCHTVINYYLWTGGIRWLQKKHMHLHTSTGNAAHKEREI